MFHRQSNCPALPQHHDQVKVLTRRLLIIIFVIVFVVIAVFVHDVVDVIGVIVVENNDFAIATVSMVVSIRQS